jgi:MFS family permease
MAPLRHRDFALYILGNGASGIGSQAQTVAVPWLLYQLTGSPILLGLGGLFQAVPTFVMVPLAGTLADRLAPRRILVIAQAVSFSSALVLGLLVLTGLIHPVHIYAVAFVQACVGAFDVTARQALFPRLVPRDQLDHAVNMNFAQSRVAMSSGPAIGGVLIAAFGPAVPILFNAASYLFMLVAMLVVADPAERQLRARRDSVSADVFAGMRFMAASPVISSVMIFAALWAVLSYNVTIVTVFAEDVLQTGPQGLGLLLSAANVGQLAGSLGLVAHGEVRRKGLLLTGLSALYVVAMLGFAFSPWLLLSAGLILCGGISHAVFSATRHAMLQHAAPEDLRGRVMGTHLLVTRGLGPVSQTVMGLGIAALGPVPALVVSTVGIALVTIGIMAGSPALRNYGRDRPASPEEAVKVA